MNPGDYIHNNLTIQVYSTKATVNREVEFQSAIAVMNLIVQMGQQMLQLTQSLAPQASGVIAHELVKALRPVFKKVMQYADAPSADEAISVLNVLERVLPAPEMLGINSGTAPGSGPVPPGQPGGSSGAVAGAGEPGTSTPAQSYAELSGMANLLSSFGSANGGRSEVAQ